MALALIALILPLRAVAQQKTECCIAGVLALGACRSARKPRCRC
jgi:hypothetical protein